MQDDVITMAHGSGGASSAELMRKIFSKHFDSEVLARLEDAAVIDMPEERLAISTDSFVVSPLIFPGGDIGKLAVCGTVNDLLMSGAEPRYLTCGFILETGLSIELLDSICASLAEAAAQAGVMIIAGDTKVIEGRGDGGGLMINTTGIGVFDIKAAGPGASRGLVGGEKDKSAESPRLPSAPTGIKPGDVIIISGNLGDHHAAILSARMGIKNNIESDCAILTPIVQALKEADVDIHAMRDVTRGGLATILNELAEASKVSIKIDEEKIPVNPEVKAFCGIMGLDPLYMGNEGKFALAVAPEDAERALAAMRKTDLGRDAAIIGAAVNSGDGEHSGDGSFCVRERTQKEPSPLCSPSPLLTAKVLMRTRIGGTVRLDVLYGEGLPRIC